MSEPTTDRIAAFIATHGLDAEIIPTPQGVPTVEAAASALGVSVNKIIKTLVFLAPDGRLAIGIACGTGRVDRAKLAAAAGLGKLKLAPAQLVIDATGYAPGGVAPFDLPAEAVVIVDERVVQQTEVYGGSGTDLHMVRVQTADVVRLNRARIADILQGVTP